MRSLFLAKPSVVDSHCDDDNFERGGKSNHMHLLLHQHG